eukprot:TRINITY_DN9234_c2_g1_i3.p1 TRINITY_DN9234_c2_g1~~TRINITY_DN9234_c2_g1_i3.p1  ORF type:complete len:351 (+),score=55.92 TRINITY_DN9234_c2_g1_i3:60-1112(+)
MPVDSSFYDSLLSEVEEEGSSMVYTSANSTSMPSGVPAGGEAKRGGEETIVTTPWYSDGAVKEHVTLSDEVKAFGRLQNLTLVERSGRTALKDNIQQIVSNFWEGSSVLSYGSFANSISIPQSTVDLVVEDCDLQHFPAFLEQLPVAGFKITTSCATENEAFATVTKEGVTLSLCVAKDKNASVHLHKHTEKLKRIIRKAPAIPPAYAVLRAVLQQTRHNDTATGGLPSYALLLMITFITNMVPEGAAKTDPGLLIVEFFHFFGSTPPGVKVCPKTGEFEKCKENLYVSDLIDSSHNTASGCTRYMQIRAQFAQCGMALEKWSSNRWRGYRGRTPLSSILAYGTLWERCG